MAKEGNFLLILISCLFLGTPSCSSEEILFKLMQGQQLRNWEHLLSAKGIFKLGFFSPTSSTNQYLGIWYSKLPHDPEAVWVANPENPILDKSGVLSLDGDGKLKITHSQGQVILFDFSQGSSHNLTATLLDTGNFVLERVNSDGTGGQILWQSFDYPTNNLLPGMKLGMNLKNGYNWTLSSWLSNQVPIPGAFKLGMDPSGAGQLVVWRREDVYWTSGMWKGGDFQMAPELTRRVDLYQFRFISNSEEQYFSFSAINSSTLSRWELNAWGQILQLTLAADRTTWQQTTIGSCKIDVTYPNAVCLEQKLSNCRNGSELFVPTRGYYNSSELSYSNNNLNLALSDCHDSCWNDCSCIAYGSLYPDGTGCQFWRKQPTFVQNEKFGVVYSLKLGSSKEQTNEKGGMGKSFKERWWLWCILAIALGLVVLLLGYFCYRRRRKLKSLIGTEKTDTSQHKELLGIKSEFSPIYNLNRSENKSQAFKLFSFSQIVDATDNFSFANKLGEGGFGPVYKGTLLDGQPIAVKRLARNSGQGLEEFMNEITLIAELQHMNLVKLLGCCIQEEEKMLVYEYLSNKSLDTFLFDPTKGKLLDWKKRIAIVEGVAQGLLYLHKYSRLRVIHRDLKASNILLDNDMNPKISDFGMARIFGHNESRANTNRVVGTYGYMSPEYAMNGIFSVKSDVFSFGVLLLEIVSGKKNTVFHSSSTPAGLIHHAWDLWKRGDVLELKDGSLESCPKNELLSCIQVALLCVQASAADRPTMSDVISSLKNDVIFLQEPKEPAYATESEANSPFPDGKSGSHSVNNVSISIMQAR
ncbi:S-locus glycoprotein domain - like 10 [Theobroma cacao]|nr:S-locus glycoprotein domain - like 10 [Theobroma cacao]